MDYQASAEQLLKDLLSNEITCRLVQSQLTDLIHGELAALLHLKDAGTVSASQLSQALGVNTSRIAALLRQLENKEYIQRSVNVLDRRKTMVTITDTGREYVQAYKEKAQGFCRRLLEQLGEEDAETFVRITHKISLLPSEDLPPEETPRKRGARRRKKEEAR